MKNGRVLLVPMLFLTAGSTAAPRPAYATFCRAGADCAPPHGHAAQLQMASLQTRHHLPRQRRAPGADKATAAPSRDTAQPDGGAHDKKADGSDAPHAASALPASGEEAVETVESADVTPVAVDGAAGSDSSTWYGEAWPMFDRVIDAYTARASRKRTFNTLISHRNNAGFARAPFDTLFGFDQGSLKIGLGLRYGILDGLDVGVLRVNGTYENFDTYEFDARYQFFQQAKFGVDMAVRVGFSWFPAPGKVKDSAAPFAQLMANRVFANRALVGFGLLYHQNSSGPHKSNLDSSASMAVQLFGDVRVVEGLSLALEYTQPVAGYHEFNPNLTFGPRFITNRHTFAIVMSNTQYYDADGIITGNNRTSFRDFVLGFNITREL